jgi:hypothetical protein
LIGEAEGQAAVSHETVRYPTTGTQLAGRRAEYVKERPVELPDAAESRRERDLGDSEVGVVQ